jgi:hypothetical protein
MRTSTRPTLNLLLLSARLFEFEHSPAVRGEGKSCS